MRVSSPSPSVTVTETFLSLEKGNTESQVLTSPQHNLRLQKEALPSSASADMRPGEPPEFRAGKASAPRPRDHLLGGWPPALMTHTRPPPHTQLLERPPGEGQRPRGRRTWHLGEGSQPQASPQVTQPHQVDILKRPHERC